MKKIKNHNPLEGLFSAKINDEFITGKVRDLITFSEEYPIINLSLNKIPNIPHHSEPETNIYTMNASLDYPIIVMVNKKGEVIRVLDGNHRIQKAIYLNDKKIKAKLIPDKDILEFFGNKNLKESIKRIKQMMGIVTEENQEKQSIQIFSDGGESDFSTDKRFDVAEGIINVGNDIYISKDKEKLPNNTLILEHRYWDKIKIGKLGLFAGNLGDVDSSFGDNVIYISIGKNTKMKTISNTYKFLEKKGILDKPSKYIIDKYGKYGIKTYRDLSLEAYKYLDNPNDWYYEFQKKTLELIEESGEDIDVLEMLSEDELTPHQFIIKNIDEDIIYRKKNK